MNVTFALGAEADLVSGDELRSGLRDTENSILSKMPPRWKGNRMRIPQSANAGVAAATGTWVLDFGSPSGGDLWWVIEVVVTGPDDRTAVAGAFATLYAGAPPGQNGNALAGFPAIGGLIRPGIAVPGFFPFSRDAFAVKDGENLFAVVYSPTTPILSVSAVATVVAINASAVSYDRI
jgi:hypothetical protein